MTRRQMENRRGIALVVVLGFLSILILMAVALVTLTRTERLVAATTVEGARANAMVRGVIGSAMDAINRDFWAMQRIHPSEDRAVFESQGAGGPVGGSVQLFTAGEVTNWLPRKYQSNANMLLYASNIWANSAQWVLVRDPASGTWLGRYAFLALDCTGMLDANLIAEPDVTWSYVNQLVRNNARHVPFDPLPEAGGAGGSPGFAASAEFIRIRTNYHGFSTFWEIISFNSNNINPNVFNNLAPYSLSYESGWWNWNESGWRRGMDGIPENVNDWTAANAENAFRQLLGVDPAMAVQMGQAFVDYTDSDRVPQAVNTICTEAVPMLNEFVVRGRVDTDAGGVASVIINIDVETWYPFPSRTPLAGYNFGAGTPRVSGTPGAENILCVIVAGGPAPYVAVGPSAASLGPINYNDGNPQLHPNALTFTITPNPPVATGIPMQVGIRLQRISLYDDANREVDLAVPESTPMIFGVAAVPAAGGTAPLSPRSLAAEVDDPRLNHLASSWSAAGEAGSPGALNGNGQAQRNAEGAMMFVRDGPLESVGELGFISTGAVWGTVGLYTRGGRELLSRFRTEAPPPVTQFWTNGCLNPNSLFRGALRAAFYGVESAEVPQLDIVGRPASQPWTDLARIDNLADSMYQHSRLAQNTGSNAFDSAAGWTTLNIMQPAQALALAGLNNNRRESIIRNSYKMFTPTENLYTVFAVAQTFQNGDTNVISGDKRAVALVWRDPFPNTAGRHEWFIRQFRWLEE